MIYMTFFRGCFGAYYTTGSRPKTPLKRSYRSYFRRAQIRWVIWRSSTHIEAQKPTQNPELPTKKHRVHTNFFENFARIFAFFPVTRVSQEPNRNYSQKLVQMNLYMLGGFWRGWIFLLWTHQNAEKNKEKFCQNHRKELGASCNGAGRIFRECARVATLKVNSSEFIGEMVLGTRTSQSPTPARWWNHLYGETEAKFPRELEGKEPGP